jgi:ADP-heptose:LPS heptosyltransferase
LSPLAAVSQVVQPRLLAPVTTNFLMFIPFCLVKRWMTSIEDTAALVAEMDLVISVCTSFAHLAGSMGRECWVMLPFNPDWRWLLDRQDSPWYASVRLFRQKHIGDWAGVFDEIRTALHARFG